MKNQILTTKNQNINSLDDPFEEYIRSLFQPYKDNSPQKKFENNFQSRITPKERAKVLLMKCICSVFFFRSLGSIKGKFQHKLNNDFNRKLDEEMFD